MIDISILKNYLQEIIIPINNCILCNKEITNNSITQTRLDYVSNICNDCKEQIILMEEPYCIYCHKPLYSDDSNICDDCSKLNYKLVQNRSTVLYNEFIKEYLALYKYRGKESLAKFFGYLIIIGYDKYYQDKQIDTITYVPLHENRLTERGFNQAEQLAKQLAIYTKLPLVNSLIRIKDTKKQSKQGKWDRQLEIKDSFIIDEQNLELIIDKNILIIDDIYTTGATLKECAKMLNLVGGKNIYGLTLSRPR